MFAELCFVLSVYFFFSNNSIQRQCLLKHTTALPLWNIEANVCPFSNDNNDNIHKPGGDNLSKNNSQLNFEQFVVGFWKLCFYFNCKNLRVGRKKTVAAKP